MWLIARSALLGIAAGGRSLSAPAAVAFGSGSRAWQVATTAAAAGEFVLDKLPNAPSRLAAAPLAGRLLFAGVAATFLARREGRNPVAPALAAAAGAAAGTYAGARWRAYAANRHWAALPAALAEDAVTWTLATTAARR
ncbi:hypothetical protein Dvina_42920 [Dactylosporangium vinaceum]|uniref:DUF4126 domain-containing protein n=1 Tax=Dactylosporangium vinaceum TaxID=53362 RepID=A0ABV5MHF4_9ACTN|nr:hypothetical protein [Dactylosporangium vinaceum]UAB94790.1 hypothetical protein Dvina_42920 [Dactylosporangium vinaceum]